PRPADHLRMRADQPAEHRPGPPPAQLDVPEPEDQRAGRANRDAAHDQDAAARPRGGDVSGDVVAAAESGGSAEGADLDHEGADAEGGRAGFAVDVAQLARIPVQSLIFHRKDAKGAKNPPRKRTLYDEWLSPHNVFCLLGIFFVFFAS